VAEVHLIAVHPEDLVLRVAFLDLNREERFLDFSFRGLIVSQEQLARQLLRQRAGAVHAPAHDVVDERDDDAGNAQTEVLIEAVVFGGKDGVLDVGRNRLVGDHFPALDGELADDFAARAIDARDSARCVVIERGDLRKIAGESEEHTGRDAERRGDQEERDDPRAPGDVRIAHRT
jgi:hypothetical protein